MATVDEQLAQRNQQAQQNYNTGVQNAQATSAQNLSDTNALLLEQQRQQKSNWEKMKTWSAEGLAADNAASQQQLSDRMAYNDATHQQRVADTNAITQQRLDAARQQYDADTAGALAYRDQQNQQSAERRTAEDAAAREENARKLAEYQAALNAANTGTQDFYNQQKAEYLAAMNEANLRAQATYDQRNAEAQRLYNERSAESHGRINSMYDQYLAAQNQQYKAALDRGIAAQEEARAGVAKSYQTAANDLSVQAERNKRNQNMQALANGLNTGTNSQQQLALNQAYMKNYGSLRGEEAAQNAGIDRAIANLKVDYENNIAKALADNNFQRASALLEDYKSQVAWLDNQRMNNQNRLDTSMDANQSRFDTYNLNGLNYMYDQLARNQSRYDTQTMNAENRLNSQLDYNRQVTDTDRINAESRYAQQMDTAANRRDTGLQNAQNYGDTMNLNELNRYDTTRANDQAAYDAQMQANKSRADTKWYTGFETFQNAINRYDAGQLAALQNSQNQNYDAQTRLLAQLYDAQQNNWNWADTENRRIDENARQERLIGEERTYSDKVRASENARQERLIGEERAYNDQVRARENTRQERLLNEERAYNDKVRTDTWAENERIRQGEYAREDNQYNDKQALLKADTLASYGDFSGYAALYGQETANLMKQMWINQNPQMAWQAGLIDDATYQRWLTGPGAAEAGGGGGGGYYGGTPKTEAPPSNDSGSGKKYKGGGTTASSSSSSAFERAVAAGNSYSSGGKGSLVSTKSGFTPRKA